MTKLMSILCTWHSADADVHAWFVVVGADTWLHNDIMNYYRPQRNCGQGYVFTRV